VLYPPKKAPHLGKKPLWVDFTQPRFTTPVARKSPLGRACGFKPNEPPMVVDLTAGLGRDGWQMAGMGASVLACERHPVIYALLADGLMRARQSEHGFVRATARQMVLQQSAARQLSIPSTGVDCLYFDPMFPERRKSALVKKPMRIFAELVGEDKDHQAVFDWAMQQPVNRVVVKRPPHAPALLTANKNAPDLSFSSSRVRFDCYFPS